MRINPVLSRFPQPVEASLLVRWGTHWTTRGHHKGLPCPGFHDGRCFKNERSPPRIPSKLKQIIRCLHRNAWERWRLSGQNGFSRQRMEGNFLQVKDRVVIDHTSRKLQPTEVTPISESKFETDQKLLERLEAREWFRCVEPITEIIGSITDKPKTEKNDGGRGKSRFVIVCTIELGLIRSPKENSTLESDALSILD